jgi:hypothetical protein
VSKGLLLHAVPGRVRLRAPAVKADSSCAHAISQGIKALPGVYGVAASPLTGSLVVTYDASRMREPALIEQIAMLLGGPIGRPADAGTVAAVPQQVLQHVAKTVAKAAVEAAVKRAILGLV